MKYVVFDTSWLESIQYDFSFAAFRCIQYTDYKVLIPHIVDEEIKKHILEKSKEFVSNYNDSLKKTKMFAEVIDLPGPLDIDQYKHYALLAYDMFKNTLRAEIVPSNLCDIDIILNDYFEKRGAFSNSGKKAEFPDAIAINSVLKFVGAGELTIFTLDNDWKNVFDKIPQAKIYSHKVDLFKIIKTEDLAGEVIDLYLDNIGEGFPEYLRNSFVKLFSDIQILYPENCRYNDLNVEDFEFDLCNFEGFEVVDKDDENKTIVAAISFAYWFSLDVSFDDNLKCIYDKENNLKRNVLRKYQKIHGDEYGYCVVKFEFGDETFSVIKKYEITDVDFCFKDADSYTLEEKEIIDADYYDKPW